MAKDPRGRVTPFEPPDVSGVPLPVLYVDPWMAVVDKPAGMLSIPGRDPRFSDSVATRIQKMFPEATGPLIAHRLDMDTSGLMVVGLVPVAQRALSMAFEARRVHKRYEALLAGRVVKASGIVSLPHRLDVLRRPYQVVDWNHGKPSVTRFRVLDWDGDNTRVSLFPLTGRTHQLRLHAAHDQGLDAPICGDRLYGDPASAERLLLHATELHFDHPASGRPMTFLCPADFFSN